MSSGSLPPSGVKSSPSIAKLPRAGAQWTAAATAAAARRADYLLARREKVGFSRGNEEPARARGED